jgi:hypothetical protein
VWHPLATHPPHNLVTPKREYLEGNGLA